MTDQVNDHAFEAAVNAWNKTINNSDETTALKAALAAYLDVLHIHVTVNTPTNSFALTGAEADDIFKPKNLEIDVD